MRRALLLLAAALLMFGGLRPARAVLFGATPLRALSDAITEIDLERAQKLAQAVENDTPAFLVERARLLVYKGDCVGATAMLSNPALTESKPGAELAEIAKSCARATAAGFVIEDAPRGIWLRVQDDADRALAPFIFDVAARARDTIGKELGVDLPRPLRIDLVRDLFSLSAVTGLPLEAAETTGTLAVARFGRIIALSPRATRSGYHWEDTMAHELTHLLVTRATRDRAPLWLQEGIAKREETRWREPRPFDAGDWAEETAARALRRGRSVGIDKLGPSIAMLPTPEAASTAYAEVQSFVEFFVRESGDAALSLLFADLKGLGEPDPKSALVSVSGYDLSAWNLRWQRYLSESRFGRAAPEVMRGPGGDPREAARRARLSDLLLARGHARAARATLDPKLVGGERDSAYRFRLARAELALKDEAAASPSTAGDAEAHAEMARKFLGTEADLDAPYGPWFALKGRLIAESPAGKASDAEVAFGLGIALDPLSEEAACEGHFRLNGGTSGKAGAPVGSDPAGAASPPVTSNDLPKDPARRALCESARALPQD